MAKCDSDEFLDVHTAAERFCMSLSSLRDKLRQGKYGKGQRKENGHWMVSVKALRERIKR